MRGSLKRIVVVRNDRLGDFMLALPSFILLKHALPQAEIHALVPTYTQELAEACNGIDRTVIDPGPQAGLSRQMKLLRQFRQSDYDAVITLYSTTRIGVCVLLAGIPYRLAPATKIAQVFYNKRLRQRRSRSSKPEYAYNLDLCRKFLEDFGLDVPVAPTSPYLEFPAEQVRALRDRFCKRHAIEARQLLVFVHPGHGGSANNLSLAQYSQLARALRSAQGHTIVITAGPGEQAIAEELAAGLGGVPHVVHHSREGLRRFAEHIQFADLFISGSTGPLHIAGALDRPTAAFYPRRRSATELRWQTLSAPKHRLAFSVPAGVEEGDMQAIDIEAAAAAIGERFLRP